MTIKNKALKKILSIYTTFLVLFNTSYPLLYVSAYSVSSARVYADEVLVEEGSSETSEEVLEEPSDTPDESEESEEAEVVEETPEELLPEEDVPETEPSADVVEEPVEEEPVVEEVSEEVIEEEPVEEVLPAEEPAVEEESSDEGDENTEEEGDILDTGASDVWEEPVDEDVVIEESSVDVTPSEDSSVENVETQLLANVEADSVEEAIEDLDLDAEDVDEVDPEVITDKADYAPTDTVVVTGTGFDANQVLTIVLTTPEEDDDFSFEETVVADDNGNFIYAYQLDGTYRPNYDLEVQDADGEVLAQTSFTDAPPSANLEQCRNGSAASPNDCEDLGGSDGWVTGNAGSTQAHHVEGFSIPYREVMGNLPLATPITLVLEYDIKHSDRHAIDYLTHYDRLEDHSPFGHPAEDVDPTDGVSGVSGTVTTFPIPAPSSAGSPVAGQPTSSFNALPAGEKVFTLFGGTITDVQYVSQGSLSASQGSTSISVTFTADSGRAVLAWGGHIASRLDWGFDGDGVPLSAGGVSGSPYHMRNISWTLGTLGNEDRSLSAGAVIPPGNLTIVKDVVPDDSGATLWDFLTTGPNSFSQNTYDLADGDSEALSVPPGTYTITETTDPNYITSVSCSTGESDTDGSITVDLSSSESIVCTFVNTALGNIIVEKQTLPDGIQDPFSFTASYDADGFSLSDGQTNDSGSLLAGTYSVSETVPAGWDLTSATCSDGSDPSAIDLDAGETVTCTFTNTQLASVTVIKEIVPFDSSEWDFLLTGPGPIAYGILNLGDGESDTRGNLTPGAYNLSESIQGGYETTVECTKGETGSDEVAFTLDPGENNTCTFTNTKLSTITIKKDAAPDNSQDFAFTVTEGGLDGFSLDDDDNGTLSDSRTFENLTSGQYTFAEGTVEGWDLTDISCEGDEDYETGLQEGKVTIDLDPGENVTCTFVNTQRGEISGYKYEDEDGEAQTANDRTPIEGWIIELYQWVNDAFEFVASDTTDANGFYSFENLLPGVYKLVELMQAGWTKIVPVGDQIDVTLDAGETDINNNFANFENSTIVVHKNVVGPDGVTEVADATTFTALLDGAKGTTIAEGTDATYSNLAPGTYTITEDTEPFGYEFVSINDDDPSTPQGQVKVTSGNTFNVYVTNRQLPATIIVDKDVPNTEDGTVFTFDLEPPYENLFEPDQPLTEDGGTLAFTDLIPGSPFNLSEDANSNYDTSVSCLNQNQVPQGDGINSVSLTLDPGETVTCLFVNNRLWSISGHKFNDINGSGTKQAQEPYLSGWTFNLQKSIDNVFETIASDVTDGGGNWSFDQIAPGTYRVVEELQAGWVATNLLNGYPSANGIAINYGATPIINVDFGNQGRGTITVNKQLDTDGDGDIDLVNPEGWTWDILGGAQNSAMGSSQGVLAGEYTISEDQHVNYHVLSLICGETNYQATESGVVAVNPGDQVDCTFTNTRDTGEIIIHKILDADGSLETTEDQTPGVEWVFDVDGTGADTSDPVLDVTDVNGDTGTGVIKTGEYTAVEGVQDGYHIILAECLLDDAQRGTYNGTDSVDGINVGSGETVECTFINTRDTGSITGSKFYDENGDGSWNGEEAGLSGWTMNLYETLNGSVKAFTTTDELGNYSFENLPTGTYFVCEVLQTGWVQTYPEACHEVQVETNGQVVEDVDFGNRGSLSIQVCKYEDSNGPTEGGELTPVQDWTFSIAGVGSQRTRTNCTTFANLTPGTYSVSELPMKPGWFVADGSEGVKEVVLTDQNMVVNFFNYRRGSIGGQKWDDANGNSVWDLEATPVENPLPEWTIFIDENGNGRLDGEEQSVLTDETGTYLFDDLDPGTYVVCEVVQRGWFQSYPGTPEEPTCHEVVVTSGQVSDSNDFGNFALGRISGRKYNDINGNGEHNGQAEGPLAGWTIYLDLNNNSILDEGEPFDVTGEDGAYFFEDLMSGTYTIREVQQVGWVQTDPTEADATQGGQADGSYVVEIVSGINQDGKLFGNLEDQPLLFITKTNDEIGNDLFAGDDVLYTLTVTADGNVNDVIVTDLLPEGFVYRSGSWTATSSVRGDISGLGEPTYASPGDWTLGDMVDGEVVTLTYIADISGDTEPGLYKDLAWTQGTSNSGGNVLGNVDTGIFVGTAVNVIDEDETPSAEADVDVNEIVEEVLGASLPDTGANTIWVTLASLIFILGTTLVATGVAMSKGYGKKLAKALRGVIPVLVVALAWAMLSAGSANAAGLSIKLEEPESPTNDETQEIVFVTLDIFDSPITVKCFKKGPSDGGFSQFGSDIAIPAGGGTGSCDITLSDDGDYQFYASATTAGDSVNSETVNVDVDSTGPGKPRNLEKDRLNDCEYRIEFDTADDNGQTVRVEIYRSKNKEFDADDSNKTGDVNVGSDEHVEFDNSVDCGDTYYYAVRAFDSAGNASSVENEEIEETTTITTTSTTEEGGGETGGTGTGGAIVVGDANLPGEGGEDGTEEGGILGESTPASEDGTGGEVAGDEAGGGILGNKWTLGALLLLILALIYFYAKKKKA